MAIAKNETERDSQKERKLSYNYMKGRKRGMQKIVRSREAFLRLMLSNFFFPRLLPGIVQI